MGQAKTAELESLPISLEAIDPKNAESMQELTRQRLLCGWGAHDLPKWQAMMVDGDRVRRRIRYTSRR